MSNVKHKSDSMLTRHPIAQQWGWGMGCLLWASEWFSFTSFLRHQSPYMSFVKIWHKICYDKIIWASCITLHANIPQSAAIVISIYHKSQLHITYYSKSSHEARLPNLFNSGSNQLVGPAVISNQSFSNSYQAQISWVFPLKLYWGECYMTSLMIS